MTAGRSSYDVPMGGQLEGKVVLVSGGASDMGRAAALRLAVPGTVVVASSLGTERCGVGGGGSGALEADRGYRMPWTSEHSESFVAFVERAVTEFGSVDDVDHSAAWTHASLDTDAVDLDLGVWGRAIEIATHGALLLARHAVPVMVAGGGGSFVTISSGTSTMADRPVAYGVAEAGLDQLTRHHAVATAAFGVRADAIAPGSSLTETAAAQVPLDVQAQLAEADPSSTSGHPRRHRPSGRVPLQRRHWVYVNGHCSTSTWAPDSR